ncbi:MAG: DUF5063 domain-containing protein [Bacteroidales bacterium]|nr:DUF5063 domain-containing protein [Bacteroidales bacterium]
MESIINKDTLEFLTVANEYCAFLEKADRCTKKEFVAKMQKILPLLYLKAAMLPETDEIDGETEIFVSEYDYDYIKNKIAQALGSSDAYINIFAPQDNSDEYEQAEMSECATDIYQDLKNFSENCRLGSDEAMNAALYQCRSNFKDYWGLRLLSLQAALHRTAYNAEDDAYEDDISNTDDKDAINHIATERNGNSLINNFLENYHKKIN